MARSYKVLVRSKNEEINEYETDDVKINYENIYFDKDITKEIKIPVKVDELIYRSGKIYLHVLNLNKNEPQKILLDKILSIKQQPKKITTTFSTNKTVIFGLKGRLAKNYKIRDWEISDGYNGEWLIIKNKDEAEEDLTKRILKYGNQCVVFSPTSFKEKIHSEFQKMLELYE